MGDAVKSVMGKGHVPGGLLWSAECWPVVSYRSGSRWRFKVRQRRFTGENLFWTLLFFIIDPTESPVAPSKVQFYAARAELKKAPRQSWLWCQRTFRGGKKEKEKKIEYIFRCIIDTVYLDTEYFFLLMKLFFFRASDLFIRNSALLDWSTQF